MKKAPDNRPTLSDLKRDWSNLVTQEGTQLFMAAKMGGVYFKDRVDSVRFAAIYLQNIIWKLQEMVRTLQESLKAANEEGNRLMEQREQFTKLVSELLAYDNAGIFGRKAHRKRKDIIVDIEVLLHLIRMENVDVADADSHLVGGPELGTTSGGGVDEAVSEPPISDAEGGEEQVSDLPAAG